MASSSAALWSPMEAVALRSSVALFSWYLWLFLRAPALPVHSTVCLLPVPLSSSTDLMPVPCHLFPVALMKLHSFALCSQIIYLLTFMDFNFPYSAWLPNLPPIWCFSWTPIRNCQQPKEHIHVDVLLSPQMKYTEIGNNYLLFKMAFFASFLSIK